MGTSGLPFRWCRICGLPCIEEPAKAGRCCSQSNLRELSAEMCSEPGMRPPGFEQQWSYCSHALPCALRPSSHSTILPFFLRRLHSWLNSRLYSSLQRWDNGLVIWLHTWGRRARRSVRSALLELAAAFLFAIKIPGLSFRACSVLCSSAALFGSSACAVGCAHLRDLRTGAKFRQPVAAEGLTNLPTRELKK